jgi:tetratricopeptide (TPR) repeat protein
MLLAIAGLFRNFDEPLLNPLTIYLLLTLPVAGILGGLLFFRITWAWYGAMVFSAVDLIVHLAFQLLTPRHPMLPIAGIVTDLMIMGLLLTVFDEVRKETLAVDMLPDHALPKTPLDLYNRGVEYSHKHLWYLAARMWQRAVALGNHEARYRRALGLAYLRLNEHAAAEAELRAALKLEPDDPRAKELLEIVMKKTP